MLGKLRETGKFDKLKMLAGGQSSSISAVSIIKDSFAYELQVEPALFNTQSYSVAVCN